MKRFIFLLLIFMKNLPNWNTIVMENTTLEPFYVFLSKPSGYLGYSFNPIQVNSGEALSRQLGAIDSGKSGVTGIYFSYDPNGCTAPSSCATPIISKTCFGFSLENNLLNNFMETGVAAGQNVQNLYIKITASKSHNGSPIFNVFIQGFNIYQEEGSLSAPENECIYVNCTFGLNSALGNCQQLCASANNQNSCLSYMPPLNSLQSCQYAPSLVTNLQAQGTMQPAQVAGNAIYGQSSLSNNIYNCSYPQQYYPYCPSSAQACNAGDVYQ